MNEGKYIENPNARAEVKVGLKELQDANILKNYYSPLIDNELEIKENDNYRTQLTMMVEWINIENQITERQDKYRLLRNIEIIL